MRVGMRMLQSPPKSLKTRLHMRAWFHCSQHLRTFALPPRWPYAPEKSPASRETRPLGLHHPNIIKMSPVGDAVVGCIPAIIGALRAKLKSMTKAEFIESLAQSLGQNKQETERVLEVVVDGLRDALLHGEKLDLRGFGTFKVRESKARQARNPRTGEVVYVPAKRVAVFKPSKELLSSLNKTPQAAQEPEEAPAG
jgi:integration host factor subunit beta